MEDNLTTSKTQLTLEDADTHKTPVKTPLRLLAGAVIAVIITLAITTAVFVLQRNDVAAELRELMRANGLVPAASDRETCTTKQCFDSAYVYLSHMNLSQNPCDDFYEYACGGWIHRNPIPGDRTVLAVTTQRKDELMRMLKVRFERSPTADEPSSFRIIRNDYKSCEDMDTLNALGAEPLTGLLASLGGWPVLGPAPAGGNWDPSAFDFEKLWAHLRGRYNIQVFVSTDVRPDFTNATGHTLIAYNPRFVVPRVDTKTTRWMGVKYLIDEPDDYESLGLRILLDENYSEERQAYLQYLVDIAVALGANETVAWHDMTDLIEFESHMANLTVLHPDGDGIDTTLGEIGMDLMNWTRFVQLMLPASIVPGVTDDEPIFNYRPNYIGNLTVWIKDQDNRVKANYMIWRLVSTLVPFLDETFLAISGEYQEALDNTTSPQATPRWKECVQDADERYKFLSGRMYVDDHFPEEVMQEAAQMVQNVKTAFKSLLKTNDWLQETDKGVVAEKVDNMEAAIGYPDWIKDNAKLDAKYANLTATEDEYFQNNLRYREWTAQAEMALLRKDVDRDDSLWSMVGPTVFNAYYFPWSNGIVLPAVIFQPPFYHGDLPWYSIYGAIGFVIGHEITHGFDNNGRQFDKDGNYRLWWSQESIDNFLEKAQCIIDQYSSFVMPENNRSLDGERTQGENIADNGGLRESYKAYMDNIPTQPRLPGIDFTDEQMFFLSYSQIWCSAFTPAGAEDYMSNRPHSPGRYRVVGPFQNNEDFSAAFKCPAGSYMNRDVKCKVWF